jgi:adenosylcobinamide-GDP ribazoletransferase
MRGLLTAVGFLTIMPVGVGHRPPGGDFGRAAVWFPVVGLLLGLALAGLDWCGRALWDPYVAAALVLGAGVVATGGLHIDGLMDTADALFSRQSRERMLEIMRDPRSGALGVAAAVCLLAAKFAAYSHLSGPDHWRVIGAALAAGRVAMIVAVGVFPYAREQGTGARMTNEVSARHVIGAILLGMGATASLLGIPGLCLIGLAIAVAVAFGGYASRPMGGLTGDVYGALNELVELAALLAGGLLLTQNQ